MRKLAIIPKIKFPGRIAPSDQKGQSIIIIAFAFLGLIAMLGLALDLGLVYIERTRIKRTVDAATLAGVAELPHEEKAYIRAMNYLDGNGYELRDSGGQALINIWVRGCAHRSYLNDDEDTFKNFRAGNPDLATLSGLVTKTQPANNEVYYLYFPTGPAVADPTAEFFFDTRSFQAQDGGGVFLPDNDNPPNVNQQCNAIGGVDTYGTATKFHISGHVPVDMNFMQFFGFGEVPVSDIAIAQTVDNLDVSVVFDVSGSMQFDTICYGCYEPYGDGNTNWTNLAGTADYSTEYPNPAYFHPIPTNHLPNKDQDGSAGGVGLNSGQLCFGRDGGNGAGYYSGSGGGGGATQRFVIIEAELYSANNSIYDRSFRQPGRGYWAVQHTSWRSVARMLNNGDPNTSYGTGARPILPAYTRGSWVSHHPFASWQIEELDIPFGHDYTLADAEADTSPSLEYDFITSGDWENNDGGQTRIWARMQAGAGGNTFADNSPGVEGYRSVYWTVYEDGVATPLINIRKASNTVDGPAYGGADDNRWQWIQFTSGVNLFLENGKKYTLKIWAGGVAMDLDWIAIGNSSSTAFQTDGNARATPGSAFRQACNRCNPIYGQTIANTTDCLAPVDNGWNTVQNDNTNLLYADQLFSGYQPIRDAKEAIKRFVKRLNPQFDQVGIVAYNNNTDPDNRSVKLQCLRRAQNNPVDCYSGTNPITYTKVLDLVERLPAYNGTNIAQGMRDGLEVLGIDADAPGTFNTACLDASTSSHCSRGSSAKRVMVVMTDGVANADPGGACDDVDLYQPNTGTASVDEAKDCVIFYTNIAAQNNVIIYTIGLGNGADVELMERVAAAGNGQFFAAATPAKLDEIFEIILNAVSVRLIE
ncbi:MAG TPA: Tad domain-containing protein [Anaerolineae bacterium]